MRSHEKSLPKGPAKRFGEKERRMTERKRSEQKRTDRQAAGQEPDALVCHCFGFTRQDIERDAIANGRSVIFERIAKAKAAGGCRCKELNPRGV
jgi:NAD(P)H-nitrite reductase large subunit